MKDGAPEAAYIDALLRDLAEDVRRYAVNRPIRSIFIGGGTPSLFSPEAFDRLLAGIAERVQLEDDIEITLEANPGTFESRKFAEFRALGINRLSIGIQSFDDRFLQALGRVHSAREAQRAVEIAQQAGFGNLNLDLMFGLPGADAKNAVSDIRTAIGLNPTHISFYQLTLEPNTYFHKFPPKLPNDESIFEAQKACQTLLAEHDYAQYEISAYSRPGRQCRHNLNYWRFGDYLGIGAGAHGKISLALPGNIVRTFKPRGPEQYLADTHRQGGAQAIAVQELPLEFVMNRLRLKQGFTLDDFTAATGLAPGALEPGLSVNCGQNLLVRQGQHYLCSEKGWDFLDTVLQNFIA